METNMLIQKKDVITAAFVFVLSVCLWFISDNTIEGNVSELGADFMPKLVSSIMGLVSLILLATNLMKEKKKAPLTKDESLVDALKINQMNVFFTIGLLFLYILFLQSMGFIVMTILYIFFQIFIFSKNKKEGIFRNLIISVCVTGFIYYGFGILVPLGILS